MLTLGAESATDIRCDNPKLGLGDTERLRDRFSDQMRRLGRIVQRGAVGFRVMDGEAGPCLDRSAGDAVVVNFQIDDMGGVVEGIHKGYFRRSIAEASYRFGQEMEAGDRYIVGVNAFTEGNEDQQVEILQIPVRILRWILIYYRCDYGCSGLLPVIMKYQSGH